MHVKVIALQVVQFFWPTLCVFMLYRILQSCARKSKGAYLVAFSSFNVHNCRHQLGAV